MSEEGLSIKTYRGPPPRKDLVQSPSRQRDWFGTGDIFNMAERDERTQVNSRAESRGTDNIGMQPGCNGEYVDPHYKPQRDYGSDYSKLAMQGGHRGLLQMNGDEEVEDELATSRRGCDSMSEYNRVAKQGGRRGLLSMESDEQQEPCRKGKGDGSMSEYNRIAKQGGHKDLLVIEENTKQAKVAPSRTTGGDWFSHDSNNSNHSNQQTPQQPPVQAQKPAAVVQSERSSLSAVPGGSEQSQRSGKKRFEQTAQKRDAPFATNY